MACSCLSSNEPIQRFFGPSILEKGTKEALKLRNVLSHHKSWSNSKVRYKLWTNSDTDKAAEVFLDEHGNIREPLVRGIAFDFCGIDRWYMPDCVPGIISKVSIARRFLGRREAQIITVLHANDTYIHLAQQEAYYLESFNYQKAKIHFAQRGLKFIRDGQINEWVKEFNNAT